MQKLRGIAVSPGVAIGDALVVDNEGFRIPRRFVSRDAVDDELERLTRAIEAAGEEIIRNRDTVGQELGEKYAGIFEAHLQMLRDARLRSELEEMIRQRHYSPEYAISRTLRRYAQVFQNLQKSHYLRSGPTTSSTSRNGSLRNLLGHRRETLAPPHVARAGPGPQPHAQRDGQPRSPFRPRLRHRGGRAGKPHGDRRRGAGNPRRGRHRQFPHPGLRRRPGDHRRQQGAGDPPARPGDHRPLPPRGGGEPHAGRYAWRRSATCRR